ncbi:MAG TPA: hypothetical protein VI997_01885 [Candidatus Thermoplasmatota archaeon]|nr:hypothetical protein [Candidatus Thermoplasmatota archaeon]
MVRPGHLAIATVTCVFLLAAAGPAFAGKPSAVQAWSNGFPSGPHFNLNIHGKNAGYACDPSGGGGSVFVPEYGSSQIQYLQNKKSSVTNLTVRDACGTFDGDAAQVQLPAGEYQVYARILAKPQKDGEAREVVFYPRLLETCNDSGTENFTNATSCEESFLLGTGVVTSGGVFDKDSESLVRTSGKSMAMDVTPLFQWSGYACPQAADTDGDGAMTPADVPADLDGDGDVDEADLALYLAANCTWFEHEWVFNIADLVVYGWDYENAGSKLLQVRFYPTSTTTFG